MKRLMIIFLTLAGPGFLSCPAQDADKQDIDARFTRLNTAVEQLLASNVNLQKRIDGLEGDLRTAREEQNRSATNLVVIEDMRKLAESLREVDQKRESDKQLILDKLDKIARSVEEGSTPRHHPGGVNSTTNIVSVEGYEYIVQPGDRLTDILNKANKQFKEEHRKSIKLKDMLEANPKLKPDHLFTGQKLLIPRPAALP